MSNLNVVSNISLTKDENRDGINAFLDSLLQETLVNENRKGAVTISDLHDELKARFGENVARARIYNFLKTQKCEFQLCYTSNSKRSNQSSVSRKANLQGLIIENLKERKENEAKEFGL
jgi:hypothetical protein